MAGEGQGGVTVNASPYGGVDYTTRETEGSTKLLSEMGRRRIADEDAANRALREAAAANLRPLGAENPVQAEDPYLPDGTENPNFNWGGAPQPDRPSYVEAQDIEVQRQANLTAEANAQAAKEQAALQQQAAAQAQQWAQKIDKDSDDLAKVSDPQQLLADPRDKAPRRWLTNLMIAMNNGANIVAGGTGEGALQKQINHDLDLDMRRKQLALNAVLQRAQQNGASAETLAEIQKKGGDRIEATRQALLKRFESDTMAALSAYPQHKQAAQMELAKIQQQNAQRMSNLILEHTGSTEGGKTTRVTGDKGANLGKKSESEQKMSLLGESMKAELDHIEKNPPLTDEELDQMQKDASSALAADKLAEGSQIGSAVAGVERSWGIASKSKYDNLTPESQKTANAWDAATEKYTRLLTGAGMPVDEARRMALQNMPVAGDSPEMQQFKFNRLRRESNYMIAMSQNAQAAMDAKEGVVRQRKPSAGEQPKPSEKKPGLDLAKVKASLPKELQAEIERALQGRDPKAKAKAAAFLQKVGAGQ